MNVSPAEFARQIKKSRQYVNKLIHFATHLCIAPGERGRTPGRSGRASRPHPGADNGEVRAPGGCCAPTSDGAVWIDL